MVKRVNALRAIKRTLYLSGLFEEEPPDVYPKNHHNLGPKTEKIIVSEKLYLNPELTISILAKEVGTNRTYLSRFFSEEKQSNFRDYINVLRADHAMTLLISNKQYTLADIAMLSGFGSVRALNRAFLKNHGKLPSQLRKELIRADAEPPLR